MVVLATDIAELVDVAFGPHSIHAFKPDVKGYVATAGLFVITEGVADAIRALNGTDSGFPWRPSSDTEGEA